jgi:hypothetical protein
MNRHLFIAQQTLSSWLEQDKIAFHDNTMTVKADGRSFRLIEAVRFVKVEGEGEDKTGLLGKVKTVEQLKTLGAERYCDSVIFKDVAYKVQEGFVGEILFHDGEREPTEPTIITLTEKKGSEKPTITLRAIKPKGSKPPAPAEKAALPETPPKAPEKVPTPQKPEQEEKKESDSSDEELLTQFLLKNL